MKKSNHQKNWFLKIASLFSVFIILGYFLFYSFYNNFNNLEAKAADPVEFINNSASVGMGLNGINDWSTEFPFLNLMKQSRMWITQCDDSSPAGGCKWNTEEQDKLNLDENKYVKTLPNKDDSSVFYR
jgi:hypothetical protein